MTTAAGTNWSLLEDVALCTSCVEVTHSSLTGNEMQLREMWSLIHTNYLEKMGGSRTKESMSSRWKLLSQSFTIWRDALVQASSNLRSGENYTDQGKFITNKHKYNKGQNKLYTNKNGPHTSKRQSPKPNLRVQHTQTNNTKKT
ncbi:hypothetical protein ACFX13_030163 [Malus domestica]